MAQPRSEFGVSRRGGGRWFGVLLILVVVGVVSVVYGWSSVSQRLESLRDRVDGLSAIEVQQTTGRVESLEAAVAGLREGVEALRGDLLGVHEEVGALRGDLVAHGEEIDTLRGELRAVARETSALRTDVSRSQTEIEGVRGDSAARAAEVDAQILALDERISSLVELVEFTQIALDGLAAPAVASTAAPVPAAPTSLGEAGQDVIVYRVRPGETLWEISISLTGSALNYPVLMEYNELPSPPQLRAGQQLIVPVSILVVRE